MCDRPVRSEDLEGDAIQAALVAAVEVETKGTLWTTEYKFVPALCPYVYGDGRALFALTTINSRPAYYVIRGDSRWIVDFDTAAPRPVSDAVEFRDFVGGIFFDLEDAFGSGRPDEELEEAGLDPPEWPAVDDRDGCSWRRMAWPDLLGIRTEPHPYGGRGVTILTPGGTHDPA